MANATPPAVKQKLLDLFNAETGTGEALEGVTITWAAPTNDSDYQADNIWLGDVEQEENFKVLGRQSIDELYTVEIFFQAVALGDVEKTAEDRAWALRAAGISAIRADLTLGQTVNQWVGPSTTRMETRPLPNGWLAKARLVLTCRARI